MGATLMQHSSLEVCAHAIRTCWQSFDKSDNGGDKDKELIERVGNKYKHASTLEHLNYTFYLTTSRAVLQELARHRLASLSVKSTRYTLKELKKEEPFEGENAKERAASYIILTNNELVDAMSIQALDNLRQVLKEGISNDIAKYCLPECYKTELTWTVNARSLQNFLQLRTSKAALWEIRQLALEVYEALPSEHRYLFEASIQSHEV